MMKKILIVDDRPLNLSGLSRALKVLCHFNGDIKTVINGREAIREAEIYFYNICFLDLTLPDINGMDVMKKISEISPETAIVIMSACYISDDMKRSIDENRSQCISKPFVISEIKEFIRDSFNGNGDYYRQEECRELLKKGKRHAKRRPLKKTIECSVDNTDNVEFEGDIIDISYAGIGMKSHFLLDRCDMINFKNGMSHKKGMVKWSNRLDDSTCRVGIDFI